MIENNLRHPGIISLLNGRTERKNWVEKLKQNYESQIIKDTECKSYSDEETSTR